jgi:hypothetical protein
VELPPERKLLAAFYDEKIPLVAATRRREALWRSGEGCCRSRTAGIFPSRSFNDFFVLDA